MSAQTMTDLDRDLLCDEPAVVAVPGDRADLHPTLAQPLDEAEAAYRRAVQHRDAVERRTRETAARINRLTADLTTSYGDQATDLRAERTALQLDGQFAQQDRRAAIEAELQDEVAYAEAAITALQSRGSAAAVAQADQSIRNLAGQLQQDLWRGPDYYVGTCRAIVAEYDRRAALGDPSRDSYATSVLIGVLRDRLGAIGIEFRQRVDVRTGAASFATGQVLAAAKRELPRMVAWEMADADEPDGTA